MSETNPNQKREFARIPVNLRARYQKLNPSRAEEIRAVILERPSVWAPSVESSLRDMATSGSRGPEGDLSRAMLELADQIVQLRSRVSESGGPMKPVVLCEVSGGGGAFLVEAPMAKGDLLDIRLRDPSEEPPPVRFLAEVVYCKGDNGPRCGFRFFGIHPLDQDRLIRFIYQLQRKALREAQDADPEDASD